MPKLKDTDLFYLEPIEIAEIKVEIEEIEVEVEELKVEIEPEA